MYNIFTNTWFAYIFDPFKLKHRKDLPCCREMISRKAQATPLILSIRQAASVIHKLKNGNSLESKLNRRLFTTLEYMTLK